MDTNLLSREEAQSISTLKRVRGHLDIESPYLSVDTSSFEVGSLLRAVAQYDATRTEVSKSVLLERFYRAASSVEDIKDVENLKRIIGELAKLGGCMATLGPTLMEQISIEDKALNELLGRTYERSYRDNYKSYTTKRDEPVSFVKMDDKGNLEGYDTQYNITYPYVSEEKKYMESVVKELFDFIVEYDATRTPEAELKVNEYFIKAALKAQDQEDIDYIYGTIGQLDKQGGIAYQVLRRNEKVLDLEFIKNYRQDEIETNLEEEEMKEANKAHYEEFEGYYNEVQRYWEELENKEEISKDEYQDMYDKIEAAQGSLELLREVFTEEEYEEYEKELNEKKVETRVNLDLNLGKQRVRAA